MIGTGVFTTRKWRKLELEDKDLMSSYLAGSILKGVGSVGLSLIFWVIGYLFAAGR
jgi:hypothetical protein